ncbi:hypothetical protein ACOMHN_023015 [Nucella lapillus]
MLLLKNSENLPPSVRFGLNNTRNVFYSLNQQWQLLDQVVAVVLDDKHNGSSWTSHLCPPAHVALCTHSQSHSSSLALSLNQQWQLLDQVVAVVLDDKHLHYQQWQLLDQVVAVVWVTNTYIINNGSSWTKW